MTDWILREGPKTSFRYRRSDGRLVRDARTLERIRMLAIPPAWRDVHIAASPRASVNLFQVDDVADRVRRSFNQWRGCCRNLNRFGQSSDR